MIGLQIEFHAGRIHANPWDKATNEGDVEWPPSPWRILRALVAGWFRSAIGERENFIDVLDRLAEPPRYLLPRGTTGHSRHYMPQGRSQSKPVLMLDSFISLERDIDHVARGYVLWPHVVLNQGEHTLLEAACAHIGYLGRAESWCSVTVVDELPAQNQLELIDLTSRSSGIGLAVRRLAAGASLRGQGLFSALTESTADMRKARRLVPIGTDWTEYSLPVQALMVREQWQSKQSEYAGFGPTLLRFTLERGERTPNPSIQDSLVFGEIMRSSVMRRYSDKTGAAVSLRLAGKSQDGTARAGHDHPYFLPFDSNGSGLIDGIDVWLSQGCTHDEYLAISSITRLWERGIYDDAFPVTFLGKIQAPHAKVWTTATPLILDRFPKQRGTVCVDAPVDQLQKMLERHYGGVSAEVEVWKVGRGIRRRTGGEIRIDSFRRQRINKDVINPPVVAATIRFSEPIAGPIVLGRYSHFGLGQFEPESDITR